MSGHSITICSSLRLSVCKRTTEEAVKKQESIVEGSSSKNGGASWVFHIDRPCPRTTGPYDYVINS